MPLLPSSILSVHFRPCSNSRFVISVHGKRENLEETIKEDTQGGVVHRSCADEDAWNGKPLAPWLEMSCSVRSLLSFHFMNSLFSLLIPFFFLLIPLIILPRFSRLCHT